MLRLALLHAWSGSTYENSTIIMPCIWIFTTCTRSRGKIFPAMAGNLLRNLLYISYYIVVRNHLLKYTTNRDALRHFRV